MSTPATVPLTYNTYVEQIGALAVALTEEVGGVFQFVDAPLQLALPQMLQYAELRIQRDLDLQQSQTSNLYTLTAGNPILQVPIDDLLTVQTIEWLQLNGSQEVNATPLLPTSREFIQNCYSGLANAGTPRFFAMVGDNFGDGGDTYNKVLLGPPPNYAFRVRITGACRLPSLFYLGTNGPAATAHTYISEFYPDLLLMASMIYVTMYQRNFGGTSDDPQMGMNYEKQYQALRLGAIAEENRKKQAGSAWTSYSTPVSATTER